MEQIGWSSDAVVIEMSSISVFEHALCLEYLLLPLFDCPFVDSLKILFKVYLFLNALRRFLFIIEYHFDLHFQFLQDFLLSYLLIRLNSILLKVLFLIISLSPHIQQLQSVLNCNFVVIRLAIHQELSKMEQILRLGPWFIDGALLIHVDELLLFDFAVEVLVEFPDHTINIRFGHLDGHLFKHLLDLVLGEVFVCMGSRQLLEYLE